MFQYNTQGVCSKAIYFDIEDNKLKNVSYVGLQRQPEGHRLSGGGHGH